MLVIHDRNGNTLEVHLIRHGGEPRTEIRTSLGDFQIHPEEGRVLGNALIYKADDAALLEEADPAEPRLRAV
jgi:hypothetical protein